MKNRIKTAAIATKAWTKDHGYEIAMFGPSIALLAVSAVIIHKSEIEV